MVWNVDIRIKKEVNVEAKPKAGVVIFRDNLDPEGNTDVGLLLAGRRIAKGMRENYLWNELNELGNYIFIRYSTNS